MHSDVRKIGTDGIKNVAILRLGHSVNVDLVFCMNLYSRKMLARKTMWCIFDCKNAKWRLADKR